MSDRLYSLPPRKNGIPRYTTTPPPQRKYICRKCKQVINQEAAVKLDGTFICDDCLLEARIWIGK